jgi:hypothetical protein
MISRSFFKKDLIKTLFWKLGVTITGYVDDLIVVNIDISGLECDASDWKPIIMR